ncbi:PhzF family phenazine biosynthesis protein [Nostoc sp. FACHB-110]|uniref:PhzF family phenazine biosynthesis protein n=1 Tax=Nostoc sp. FACHB-110 TaxID=2692834 RepID=UPI00168379B0|nr:PhzF family phenazine biosynthesis protein [Nostoc sp. FACHB-110]MBD2441471.1 PhzF family phenazine biosynthesis protein [Nostoc sp. FACHB-110]
MKQIITQVDAFTDTPFAGNPAAVCVLPAPQKDRWMQQIAQEMNLSETAFLIKQDDGFNLRWFTPSVEVPLCGHATLASAHVLWSEGYLATHEIARFHTKSGLLIAKRQDGWIELNFPANRSHATTAPPQLSEALGANYTAIYQNSLGYLVEVASEDVVRQMQPNFQLLKTFAVDGVIVTSQANAGSQYDFVSRFFAPRLGIDEDPVTGAAHCCLAPFWRDSLNKNAFLAYQASSRGGVVKVYYEGGDRVLLSGQAVTVMRGELITL